MQPPQCAPRPHVMRKLSLHGKNSKCQALTLDASTEEKMDLFTSLYHTPQLDTVLEEHKDNNAKDQAKALEERVDAAIKVAYSAGGSNAEEEKEAHLFLQRTLYKINRSVFFWFDDLSNYENERSFFFARLRDKIEAAWQKWEDRQLAEAVPETANLPNNVEQVQERLRRLAEHDVNPPPSEAALYISNEMNLEGYKHLLAIASVDGLVEASRQSRVCGGVGNAISCTVFKVLSEEYGNGRLHKKHSTFFAKMLEEVGLSSDPEHYLELVPWQVLASINHNFLLTERRRFYLRYQGGLTFFEVNGPSVYKGYLAAARRLGLSQEASGYWELHIKEDERHGAQMVTDVAVPLAEAYPNNAGEVLKGYLQERFLGERAGEAVVAQIKQWTQA